MSRPLVTVLEDAQGTPLKCTVERIPEESDAQVAATIERMCQYVCDDYKTAPIQMDAQSAVALDPSNPLGAIHAFVRSRIRFQRDEATAQPFNGLLKRPGNNATDDYFVEALTRPVDISLQYARTQQPVLGDCDDFSMFCAALLKALGIDCAFATVAASTDDPGSYSHVYTVAYWRGVRVPMDCSHGANAGWEVFDGKMRFREWAVDDRAAWAGVGMLMLLGGWAAWKYRKQLGELLA